MASYNKHMILGNVGSIDSRVTPSGMAVTDLSIATNAKWKDKNSGEMQTRTEWHKAVAFDRRAEVLAQYVQKGNPIFIVGESRTEKWQDKDGNDRYTTKIYIDDFQLLGSGGGERSEGGEPPAQQRATPAKKKEEPFEDDIPF